jgi:hypothetical protein
MLKFYHNGLDFEPSMHSKQSEWFAFAYTDTFPTKLPPAG